MSRSFIGLFFVAALTLAVSAVTGAFTPARADFPAIRTWLIAGAFQDSSTIGIQGLRCIGTMGPRPDSVRFIPRAVSVRFLRDRRAEARRDFGGYRIYRMVGSSRPDGGPDTTRAMLIRRFSFNSGSAITWNFSRLDTITYDTTAAGVKIPHPTYMQYICRGEVVHDSILTFVDPDSNGNYVKDCRRVDDLGRCLSKGDSVFVLKAPPGPHDGIRTWYAITYEKLNTTDYDFEDLFVADTLDDFARCGVYGVPGSCPNLNSKLRNAVGPIEPTAGPTANLERVHVVPNPYRGSETWDLPGQHEVHFVDLPKTAKIRIYTVSGDFVRELQHSDPLRDFERWDLKSAQGHEVASGIYIYRVESGTFSYQSKFIVIR